MATYEIWLHDPDGNPVTILDRHAGFSYMGVTSGVGVSFIDYAIEALPGNYFKVSDPPIDWQIHFRRTPNGYKKADFPRPDHVAMITKCRWMKKAGRRFARIWGVEPNDLLRRRKIPFTYQAAHAAFSGLSDNLMKAVVRANLGVGTGLGTAEEESRSLAAWGLQIEADTGLGESVKTDAPYDGVLDLLYEFAAMAEAKGQETFFGIELAGYDGDRPVFIFRTQPGAFGPDLTEGENQVVFYERDFLDLVYELDASEEENTIYLVGAGKANVQLVSNQKSEYAAKTSLSRREGVDVRPLLASEDKVNDAGIMVAYQRQRQITLRGTLSDSLDQPYQTAWNNGWRVSVNAFGGQWAQVIRSKRVTVSEDGRETIEASFQRGWDDAGAKLQKELKGLKRRVQRLGIEAQADKFKGTGLGADFDIDRLPLSGDWGIGTDTNRVDYNQGGVIRYWSTTS